MGTRDISAADDAPMPPQQRRLVLVLTGTLVMWLLVGAGVGAYLLQQRAARDAEVRGAAQAQLDNAYDAYAAGRFTEAREAYQAVADAWPRGSDIGEQAQAGVALAQGRLDLAAGRHELARQAFTTLATKRVFDEAHVQRLIEEAEHRAAFEGVMAQVEASIADQQFAQARRRLRDWRDRTLSDEEEARLRDVSARLEDQLAQQQRERVLRQAEALVEGDRRAAAIALLEGALEHAPSTQLRERYDELLAAQTYESALARARAAEDAGNLAEAIEAYQTANAARPSDAHAAKLNALQAEAALAEGVRLLEEGDTAGAEAALTRSLGYQDSEQARAALARISTTNRMAVFVEAGPEAAAAGDYEAAANQYAHALTFGTDTRVRMKLDHARISTHIQRGKAALEAGRLDEAAQQFTLAQQIAPRDAAVAEAMEQLDVHRAYREHLAAAEAAQARSDFGDAKRHYRRALELLDTREARRRLDEAEYDHLVAQARSYMAMEEYASAKALLSTAYQIRPTEQVAELLAEAERKFPTLPNEP